MSRIVTLRAVLLIEIERRCGACNGKARIGLTKEEARGYTGFTCERCEQHTPDALLERDVPDEWWQEFVLAAANNPAGIGEDEASITEDAAAIGRLSDTYLGARDAGDEKSRP